MKERNERFSMPILNKKTVYRRKIVDHIGRLTKSGILFVHSPAGYGKTTAVALWARYKDTVWLTLDEYSAKPIEIYRLLLTALSCEISEEFFYDPFEYLIAKLEELQDGPGTTWPEVIVIDDFHMCNSIEASETKVALALPLIRTRIPAQTAFIIISRTPPPEILIEHTIKGSIRQISSLQFSVNEIQFLFNNNKIPISRHEAENIHRRTDGWAGALAAILWSNQSLPLDLLDSATLNKYLKSTVFANKEESYSVLKKCSISDILYPGLCHRITAADNAWDIIAALAEKTGLVTHTERDIYHFHALLKDFLYSELLLDDTIDKALLYKTAAQCFMENGDIIRAIDMAARSRDLALLEECFRARYDQNNKYRADISTNVSLIHKYVLSEIPPSDIKQSLRFSLDCYIALFHLGRLSETFEWKEAARELLWNRQNTRSDIISAALFLCIDPCGDIWDIPGNCKKIMPLLATAPEDQMMFFSMTNGFPFFHKAQVDYAVISLMLEEFTASQKEYMAPVLGPVLIQLVLLIEAGMRYERGELEQAESISSRQVNELPRISPELHFSSFALNAEVKRVQGKKFDIEPIRAEITSQKAYYLYDNFKAFSANIQLYNGDTDTASHWLQTAEIENTLMFYKIYQYFTTARSLMVSGKLTQAKTLLERLAVLAMDYRRPCDYIKALTLQAICLWHTKQPAESIAVMKLAIAKAFEYRLVMPIIKEGSDILPVLNKMLNRLKYGYDTDVLDKGFVHTLFLGAQTQSMNIGCGGMLKNLRKKSIKLSPRQREILGYLEQNLRYKEISEKMGIKVTTVGDHIDKLYQKLGATNSFDAVIKARVL